VATATLLLELNADVSAKSNEGATPLHVAAWQGREEVKPKPLTPTLTWGTSLIRSCPPIGPYIRTMPRALWWPSWLWRFLMSEVPLYREKQ